MAVLIPLLARDGSVRAHAMVDAADLPLLSGHTWRLHSTGYACRSTGSRKGFVTHLMHRVILGLKPGDPRQGDHFDRDKLDNRRSNLRIVTAAENMQNVCAVGGTSRFRGVRKINNRWQAYANLAGKFHHLGLFVREEDAAAASAAFRAEHMPYSQEAAA